MIKFKGEVIVSAAICSADIRDNWCDSMAQYYPILSYTTMINGKPVYDSYALGEGEPYTFRKQIEIVLDDNMVKEYEEYRKLVAYENEFPIVRKGKIVEVYKGRKLPKGTIGKVFWVGQTKFGTSCGIELNTGQRVFTSYSNLKVLSMGDYDVRNIHS